MEAMENDCDCAQVVAEIRARFEDIMAMLAAFSKELNNSEQNVTRSAAQEH